MSYSNVRVALLAGVSVAVVGAIATPAQAQVVPGVCIGSTDTNVTDTIDISLLGVTGVTDINDPAVAIVNGCASGAIQQGGVATGTSPDGDVTLVVLNDVGGSAAVVASAVASDTAGDASAFASIHNYGLAQIAVGAGNLDVTFANDGAFGVSALANAAAAGIANATANFGGSNLGDSGFGIYQSVTGNSFGGADSIAVGIVNGSSGAIVVNASANAIGASANANAHPDVGIFEIGAGAGTIDLLIDNGGSIDILAHAAAVATSGAAVADADLYAGLQQIAYSGTTANVAVVNGGLINVGVDALALSTGLTAAAVASADVNYGIIQLVEFVSSGNAYVTNSGTIAVHADASASATNVAIAHADVGGATGAGIMQEVNYFGGGIGFGSVANLGILDVEAIANAAGGVAAFADAEAAGIAQYVYGSIAAAQSIANVGDINVLASANAVAGSLASAQANALGAIQTGASFDAFSNVGSFNVVANALASASTAGAIANAAGLVQFAPALGVADVNDGLINVSANAVAPQTAIANAVGLEIDALGLTTGTGTTVTVVTPASLTGTLTNSGTVNVVAFASGGGTFTTTTTGGGTTTVALSSANAVGVLLNSGINNTVVTNTGLINVAAITANGGPANAVGILATGNGVGTPAAGDVLTINNSGDIIVQYSTDGGATFHRGTAIDVTAAPNGTVINLLGGSVTGDINVAAGDTINVTDGETFFNGVVNAACFDGTAIADGGDQPLLSSCGVGTLTIGDGAGAGGNLHLTVDAVDGPSYVFVDTFTVNDDGTITYDLDGATSAPGTYSQVFANVANLAGTLVANISSPANGLIDSTVYDNVIDANDLNGTFDACVLDGPFAGSILVGLECDYDTQNNVDLVLTRNAFDSIAGLNANGAAVGSGLECIFDTNLTGGIANLLADLFLFDDPVNYNIALNQLAGEGYANYLQSFPSLGVHTNDLIDHATNCEVPALAGSILECRASAPLHLWGQLDYQWRKADGDSEAGTMKAKRFTGLIGLDATVGNSAILGGSVGYITNHTKTRRFGEKVDGDGFQVGLYGAYDPGQFYVKAIGTYSWLNGDSSRHINFAGLAPGATFAGTTNGDPDVNMWTFGLHGGYRIGMGSTSVVTPYVNYDYVNAKLKGFTETGLDGANLTVEGGRAKHSFLTGGLKWATQMGGVVPEVNLGYRYRFGEKRSDFTAAFIGDTACDFDVVSAAQKRGTFLAGLSVGGKMGPVDLRIGYEGEFNSDITSHSGNLKIVVPLGGHAAPPPPAPAPVVAPPPPPEPAPEAAPPPPPPPPAPVERGERGQ